MYLCFIFKTNYFTYLRTCFVFNSVSVTDAVFNFSCGHILFSINDMSTPLFTIYSIVNSYYL